MNGDAGAKRSLLRSERFPAILLLAAAIAGLVVANTPVGTSVIAFAHQHLGFLPFDLSLTHWVQDGLLAIFFFGVSVELQFELTRGELRSIRRAVQPAIAAAGGVVVPVVLYLALSGGGAAASGWPIPTATDVAFALGVLAVFGRGLPSSVRVFLLALAILDDIVGIVLIAVLYATDLQFGMLALAFVAVVLFAILSRVDTRHGVLLGIGLGVLALATWAFMLLSGVHPTIAGVLLGLAMSQDRALITRHAVEPWINGVVLPLFAFTAALVPFPSGSGGLPPVFWAVLVALPVGKLVGIAGAAWIAQRVLGGERMPFGDLVAAGALGGIGFTVSLLLANLAFASDAGLRDAATLGVLAGSLVALVLSAALVFWRARTYRLAGRETS
ncbi:Na+/H+ antiporter NhaA [Microbacterium sp. ASV49]|uniref:Na(+)/H(+) antiporter NhaA n=1 Tax=Microbacterium candidum TaxID=3041922 RepID=A0ABT7N1Y6_9MICO|nr:Na+/H+ antiporter NhaA [Microbacterium sp. ASV49]MDL9980709.1 Na+/H+ antiporter NhaA [Microbacterium sp. ASV49]